MRIDPSRERAQANEPKEGGLIPCSLLRFIESRGCYGVRLFDFLISGLFIPGIAQADDIRDVKPPIALPGVQGIWIAVLILLFLGTLAWALRTMSRRRLTPSPASPPLPPWDVAFQRLKALKDAGFPEGENAKTFYTELSDILRRYVAGRFRIKAPEMTTEEFLSHLKNAPALDNHHKLSLQDFLSCCDRVKFARFSSSVSEMERGLNLIWRLVLETQPPASHAGNGEQRVMVST
ncbi:MAG TPA: DUF4381 family protein [Candidatus Omnitrophota bacterium]|nr:DUF4381 family protein [Candidatus Omnitrophota bacterium]HQP11735.1 DUF4381 family protein [Candidatus Omnitrophota bacterium]